MLYIGAIIEHSAFHTAGGGDWRPRPTHPTVDPAHLADLLWNMHRTKGPAETIHPERRLDR
jgi:hypothetical protein